MVAMPAWCPDCEKTVTPIRGGISIEDSYGVTLSNCNAPCPECGGDARIFSGTFDVPRSGVIEVVAASEWTRAKLAEFQEAVRWAAQNFREQPDEAVRRIQQANPEIASALFREPMTRAEFISWLGFFIALLTFILERVVPLTADPEEPVTIPPAQVNYFIEEYRPTDVPPAPQPPSQSPEAPQPRPEVPARYRQTPATELPE